MRFDSWFPATAAVAFAVAGAVELRAQGVTTGAISGTVTNAQGAPLAGVPVEVVDAATGTRAGQVTQEGGRFFVANLEVGRGYTVNVRRIGFAPETRGGVVVTLSQTTRLDITLREQATQLEAVVVDASAPASEFSPTRQGAQTVISDTLVRRNPTLNRDVSDLTRLTPQVSVSPNGRQSAAGQNNRFNNIQVDGVSLANRFGLGDSPTVGAQVGGRALPLDAIREYQVLLSPYDVRQGNFTGALVNAVTQSGTNEFQGSAFLFYRGEEFARDTSFLRDRPFVRRQFGASLGGPIVRDRLRFFATAELSRNENPVSGPYFDPGATNGLVNSTSTNARVTQAQVDSFTTALTARGIPAGNASLFSVENPLVNTFARLDFQINNSNRLVVRNIYNDQQQDDFSRSLGTFNFTSNAFRRTEKSNQSVAQLFTSFGNGFSNEAIVGYTTTRFKRNPSVFAPQVLVQNVGGTANGVNFRAGTENSTQGNELRENLLELQNNFTMPLGAHTVTVGTRNELYTVYNAFLQNSFGFYTFASLADLAAGRAPNQYSGSGGLGGDVAAEFTAGQFAGYVQDLWAVNDRLTLTGGLRVDVPVFFDKPSFSPDVLADFGRSTEDIPSGNLQFSPRLGVNWDVTGDQRNQLRGGVGLFQGTPAYVWLSNQYQNTGVGLAQITCGGGVLNTNGAAPAFSPEPVAPRGCGPRPNGQPGRSLDDGTFRGTVNLAEANVKYPQLFRATVGFDRQLPWGLVGTVEGIYSRSLNNLFYTNINLPDATRTDAQGRTVYSAIGANGIPTIAPQFARYGNFVINLDNQSQDYAYSGTTQLRKRFTGSWEASAAYTYGRSYSVTDLTSSVALSNWQFGRAYAGSQFEQTLAPSAFDQRHRLLLSGTFTAPWKNFPTSVTNYYSLQSGTPFTYTYGGAGGRGDLNGDGSNANDPIYIPAVGGDSKLAFQTATFGGQSRSADEQASAFNSFINGNECLSSQRGRIMDRNSCRNPSFYTWDVSVEQGLPVVRGNRLAARLDVFNFANLLNKDWGKIRSATGNASTTLLTHQAMSSAVGDTQVPVVTFDPGTNRFPALLNTAAFYQMQLSLRYSF